MINSARNFLKLVDMGVPLLKDNLNPGFISGNAISLWLKFWIFEDQNTPDWNSNAAKWGLSECFSLNTVDKNLGPGLGIDLDADIEGNRRLGRLVTIDDVCNVL